MTARSVIARIRSLDPTARKVHQTGSHQKWRLVDGSIVMIPVHGGDVPLGTLRSIERQGERALGAKWLLRAHRKAEMREVVARYEHDGRAWVVQILDPDIATFGLTLRSAKRYARELVKTYAEVDDLAAGGIDLVDDVVLPANVEAEIDQLAEMRRKAEVLRHDVAIETRRATQQLRRVGLSTRDVGEILGISSSRVAQIEREASAV